jgi:hypothetical protein
MNKLSNTEQAVAPANFNIGGLSFFFPFLEKFKLYQTFLRKDSIWNRNKFDYWKHEKAILYWAWSNRHQHLARNLDTKRLREAYGISVVVNPHNPQDNNYHVQDRPIELPSLNKEELSREMISGRGRRLEPIMGNLYIKGLAEAVTYGDIFEQLSKVGETEIVKKLLNSSYVINSIIINSKGLLMGELVNDEETGKLWKYKITLFFIWHLVILSIWAIIITLIKQVFDIQILIPLKDIFKFILTDYRNIVLFLIGLIGWIILIWKRL